jgi:hypothetical protein
MEAANTSEMPLFNKQGTTTKMTANFSTTASVDECHGSLNVLY